uniref:KOW domain-containing protein n=2 Tax=viral metagenome TaxID=1070528 RepID=A0A6M3MEG5_9ZZZZ
MRPKKGDLVELVSRGRGHSKEGKVLVVAETGVHFIIETRYKDYIKRQFVGLSGIKRIISKVDSEVE